MKAVTFVVALALLVVIAVMVVLGFAHFVVDTVTHITQTLNPLER